MSVWVGVSVCVCVCHCATSSLFFNSRLNSQHPICFCWLYSPFFLFGYRLITLNLERRMKPEEEEEEEEERQRSQVDLPEQRCIFSVLFD